MSATPSETPARLQTHQDGPVLVTTIDNPAARNAMRPALCRLAVDILRRTATNRSVRAIVLTGEGEHFCGGGDLKRLEAQRAAARAAGRPSRRAARLGWWPCRMRRSR